MGSKFDSAETFQAGHYSPDASSPLSAVLYAQDDSPVIDLRINAPTAREESYLFDLIGRIDHKVLQGYSFYIQIRGIAYKILYGVYWRSVYSDQQFWGFRCEEIGRGMWAE